MTFDKAFWEETKLKYSLDSFEILKNQHLHFSKIQFGKTFKMFVYFKDLACLTVLDHIRLNGKRHIYYCSG